MSKYYMLMILLSLVLSACQKKQEGHAEFESPEEQRPSLELLASGAEIAGANGILFSPDGELYVASVIGSNITVIDPETGEILKQLGEEQGVIGPDDIAFSSDGSLYWTSILTGEIGAMNTKGEKFTAAQLTAGVNPITFSDDGRLFVSQCFFGTNLYEIDPKGKNKPRLISDELGPGCGLNGMDWGPDDRLYGPRWFTGEVVSFNVETNSMRVEAKGFQTPAAVKFDSKGHLHVLDTGAGKVFRLDGNQKVLVASLSPGLDNIAFDKHDRLFVSSFTDGFVQRQEDDGSLTSLLPGGMSHPGGITLLKDRLVVADLHAIRFFDKETGQEIEVQRNVLGTGKMGGAVNVHADGDNLILVSWLDNDVRVWDPKKQEVLERYSDLNGPVAAIRYAGGIVAATKHDLVLLTSTGVTKLHEFSSPAGLAVDGDDLYLVDRSSGNLYRVGHKQKILDTPELVTGGLLSPEGLVVTESGFAVVEAESGNVVNIDAAGTKKHLASIPAGSAASSTAQPDSMIFNGITIDEEGVLYLSGEKSRKLYKIMKSDNG